MYIGDLQSTRSVSLLGESAQITSSRSMVSRPRVSPRAQGIVLLHLIVFVHHQGVRDGPLTSQPAALVHVGSTSV